MVHSKGQPLKEKIIPQGTIKAHYSMQALLELAYEAAPVACRELEGDGCALASVGVELCGEVIHLKGYLVSIIMYLRLKSSIFISTNFSLTCTRMGSMPFCMTVRQYELW